MKESEQGINTAQRACTGAKLWARHSLNFCVESYKLSYGADERIPLNTDTEYLHTADGQQMDASVPTLRQRSIHCAGRQGSTCLSGGSF